MKKFIVLLGITSSIAVLISCSKEPDTNDDGVVYDATPYTLATGNLPPAQMPNDVVLTKQKVQLGRMLFYETRLSKDGSMSCASCHRQEHAFSDTSQFSIGVEGLPGHRQAMAIFNMAWNGNRFFWDGRALFLRHQSLMPIQDPLEMNETLPNVVEKLRNDQGYVNQFIRAFGDDSINPQRISLAMEQFMLTIVSINSKYDRFLAGTASLSPAEERGRKLFFGEFNPGFPDSSGADCAHCHATNNFEDDSFKNNGLDAQPFTDLGYGMFTNDVNDNGKFKVPSLRNIGVTGPYMHDGRFKTLLEVIEHYNSGIQTSPTIDPALVQVYDHGGLNLSAQDKSDLIQFLLTLTDDDLLTNPEYTNPF